MAIRIQPYLTEHEPGVAAFNQRLKAAGITFRFFPSATKVWLPKTPGRRIYQDFFVAVEDGVVRGGYAVKHQDFWRAGEVFSVAHLELPLSEGTFDKRYNSLGLQLLMDAVRKYPLLYASGMGGFGNTLPKILLSLKWSIAPTPFYFRVCHPGNFFRHITVLRRSGARRVLLDVAAMSGIGHVTLRPYHALRTHAPDNHGDSWETFGAFGKWATDLWQAGKSAYTFSAVRDEEVLNILYPLADDKTHRLRLLSGGRCVGWMVMRDTVMEGHKQFGNMRVGSLVDCFAEPGWEHAVTWRAFRWLQSRGVDLIVSNQAQCAWVEALERCGFLAGPSNYLFAAAPALAARLQPWGDAVARLHFNRGDGDGPIHL